jgi:hypothetical protein
MVTNNLGLSHSFMVNKEESPNLFFPLAKEILIYVALIIMADRFSFLSLSLSLSLWPQQGGSSYSTSIVLLYL